MSKDELKPVLLTAILLGLSFPPLPFGFLVPFALFYFIRFIEDKTPAQSFRLGYWLGLFWGSITLFWIAASTLTGAIFAIVINAFHYAILWWLFAKIRKLGRTPALLSLPFLWTALEYLRLFTDIRFNWMTLAHTQTYYLPFIQIIDVSGTLGISFVLVVLGVLVFYFFQLGDRLKWVPALLALGIIFFLVDYGFHRMNHFNQKKYPLIKAAIVQPNVDPFQKWDPDFQQEAFQMLLKSSRRLVSLKPNIIIWPETATPFFMRARFSALHRIHSFLDSTQTFLLTGTPDYEFLKETNTYKTYNAAFFFSPRKSGYQTYRKMALVPAAESMPFKKFLPFLRKIDVGGGDFFPGKEFTVFRFKIPWYLGRFKGDSYHAVKVDSSRMVRIGLSAIICYESVFPQIVRKFILNGANLLTIITNDGWFGLTNGPYQHAQFAVLRAIENRVSVIRCANTGISGFIDPTGKYLRKAPLGSKRDFTAWIPVNSEKTFYTRHGEWFGEFTLLVSFLILFVKFVFWVINRKRHNLDGFPVE